MAELTETTWRLVRRSAATRVSQTEETGSVFLADSPRVQRRLEDHHNGEAAAASASCEKPYLVEAPDDVTRECGCLLILTQAMSSSRVHVFLRVGQ